MKHRRKQGHPLPTSLLAPSAAAPADADLAQSRWRKLGGATVIVWYLGGFTLLFLGALLQVGPFAWAAAWQVRHWGSDNVVLSFLPGFAVLAAPVVLLQLLSRNPNRPFLCGARDALSPRRDGPLAPPSADHMAHVLLRLAKVGLEFSLLCLLAGGGGYFLIRRIGDRGAGSPLPELTLAAVTQKPLPNYARLTGVVGHPEMSWVHDHTVRQTRYRDVFSPLTGSAWQPDDPVLLLEEDSYVVDDDLEPSDVSHASPIEGRLERGAIPGWMVSELRRSGLAVVDDPVVLVRRDLNGVMPGADEVGAVMAAVFGSVFAVFSLGVSLAWLHRRRKLLRDAIDSR